MTSRFNKPALRPYWASAATAALLAGCAVGPDFQVPAAPEAPGYTAEPLPKETASADTVGGAAQSFETGAAVPQQWWTQFHSDKLDALVTQSLKASSTVAASQAALRQAQENMLAARGDLFPSVDGTFNTTRQKLSGASFGQPGTDFIFTLFNASVNVSYALDLFGGVRRQLEALDAQGEYARYQLEGSQLTLAANVVTTAIQAASLRAQVAATHDIIEADRKEVALVNRQFDLGAVSKVEVLTLETQLAQAAATLPPLQKQLELNRDLLAVLLGQPAALPLDAGFELSDLQLPATLPVSLPATLVGQRPDVRAQAALLHQASAQVGVATAQMLPQISISGALGGTATRVGDVVNSGNGVWSIGAGVTQPLFHGGELLHKRRAAAAAYDESAAQYRATVLSALQNVADSLHALEADADALQAQLQAEQAADASLKLAQKQFEGGATNYLTLLNAERSLQESRIALVQAQAARFADTAALFQSLGGGWSDQPDEPQPQGINNTVADAKPGADAQSE